MADEVARSYRVRRGVKQHQAVRLTAASDLKAVAEWCGGQVVQWNGRSAVKVATGRRRERISYALPDDAIVRSQDDTYTVYGGWHFCQIYEEAGPAGRG